MAFDYFVEDEQGNLVDSPMQVRISTTTDSSGHFFVNISNAGLTHVNSAHAVVKAAGTGVTDIRICSITTLTTSSVAGAVFECTETLGIFNMAAAGSGVTVWIVIEGDQL